MRAAAVALVVAGCGSAAQPAAAPAAAIANTAARRDEPPGWRWDPEAPANAAEAPVHQFRSGGCRFAGRVVTCDPGSTRTDFVKWTIGFAGAVAAYAEGDQSFYLIVLAEPPMLVAVSTVSATVTWQAQVPQLPTAPTEVARRRIQVHAADGMVTVYADEDARGVWRYTADTGTPY